MIALDEIEESTIKSFNNIRNDVDDALSKSKAIEKQNLLVAEIEKAKSEDNLDTFISAYNFISKYNFFFNIF